ncbi:MAG: hypothetical protein ACRETZ_18335, partial [Steroidobacteraceae bacterium]
ALVDTTSGTGTSYTVSGLTPYTVYTFAVSAYDANGATSGQSAGVDVPLPFEIANSTGLLAAGTSAGYTISQGEVPYGQNQYYWTVSAPDGAQVAHAQTGENGYEPACYDDQNGVSQAASGYELQQCMLWASPSVYP